MTPIASRRSSIARATRVGRVASALFLLAAAALANACVSDANGAVGCVLDADCGAGLWCSPATSACVPGCKEDADCASADAGVGGKCDLPSHACVGCLGDEGCPAGQVCSAQRCVPGCNAAHACPSSEACCGGACLDVSADPAHCGSCEPCPAVTHAAASCVAGVCGVGACVAGFADCDHDARTGCEQDVAGAADNCGSCGHVCGLASAAAACVAGACTVASCAAGRADCNGSADDGCEVVLATDVAHCGACDVACPAPPGGTASCVAGACGLAGCQTGFADCDGSAASGCESALATDAKNCGFCGNACPALWHATNGCAAGSCGIVACDPGWADCDKVAWNGCEVNLTNDPTSCGACGHACTTSHGAAACAGGTCATGACAAGYADCDGLASTGCEAAVATDAANCGVCTAACPALPHASPGCSAFLCGVGACEAGYADCNKNPGDGCESQLATDAKNCGACGAACPAVPNGTVGCAASGCVIAACNAGFADCDGVVANGCESRLATDANNCNVCGNVCAALPHAAPGCAAGACALGVCELGHSNCDGDPSNGCEKSTLVDAANCGGCGVTCGSGTCADAACVCNKKVLVIPDDQAAGVAALIAALDAAGFTTTKATKPVYQYDGASPAPAGYGAVVVLAGSQGAAATTDMPAAGQTALVNYVTTQGSGLVLTEWAAHHVASGRWQVLKPLVLLSRTQAFTGPVTYTVDAAFSAHPIWKDLPASFSLNSSTNVGLTGIASGVTRVAGSPQAIDAVALRDLPVGRVVHVAHAGNYSVSNGWSNANLRTLMANAVGWVARCQ